MDKTLIKYKYYAHILNSASDGAESEKAEEIARHIKQRINSEFDWSIERYGLQKSAQDWLQGLAINIDYSNFDILERAKEYGFTLDTEKQEDKFLENYWHTMAAYLCQLIGQGSTMIKSFNKRYDNGEFSEE